MNKSRYIQSAFALLVLLCLPASARAQSKRWEHNIYQGMGWVNKFVKEDEQNIALHVGYGINYHIDSRWSLMPGVGLRLKGFGHDNENAGNCSSTYIDSPFWCNIILAERSDRESSSSAALCFPSGPTARSIMGERTGGCRIPSMESRSTGSLTWAFAPQSITRPRTGALACRAMSLCWTPNANTIRHTTGSMLSDNSMTKDTSIRSWAIAIMPSIS